MKGVVFTEFMELVEQAFGDEVLDQIIEGSDLPSGGVYTAIGTYDHHEILTLVTHLSEITGAPVPDLVRTFGNFLFGRFTVNYPNFFEGITSAFALLERVENFIHVEVRKLYPDAELPLFEYDNSTPNTLVMTYRSKRPFAPLAQGMVEACIKHYQDPIDLVCEDLAEGQGTAMRFTLTKKD